MASTLSSDKERRPSATVLVVSTGAISFAVVLVLGAVGAALRLGDATTVTAGLALLSGLILGPLLYLVIVRPLLGARHPPTPMPDQEGTVMIDPVTHALNRRGIVGNLLEAMAQSQRYATPLCVALVAIDDFERFSERHGPQVIDRAVQVAVDTMTEVLRLPDRVGRHDYGEFLVVMPQTRVTAAVKVAERLCEAMAASPPPVDRGGAEPLTLSIGVVEFGKSHDLEKLLSQAQAALAEARAAGGNRVVRAKTPRRRKGTPAPQLG